MTMPINEFKKLCHLACRAIDCKLRYECDADTDPMSLVKELLTNWCDINNELEQHGTVTLSEVMCEYEYIRMIIIDEQVHKSFTE